MVPVSTVSVESVSAWLRRFAELVTANKDHLTELDSAIGDADHGTNMARGMEAVVSQMDQANTVDALLKKAGLALVSNVGGTSGPLYGTFLMKMGMTTGSFAQVPAEAFGEALQAGLDGLVARGKTELGDKTMVDALAPAVEAFRASIGDGLASASRAAQAAAREGRDATVPMVARKGRASYLGERSAGHLDPGAASASYLMDALAEALA